MDLDEEEIMMNAGEGSNTLGPRSDNATAEGAGTPGQGMSKKAMKRAAKVVCPLFHLSILLPLAR